MALAIAIIIFLVGGIVGWGFMFAASYINMKNKTVDSKMPKKSLTFVLLAFVSWIASLIWSGILVGTFIEQITA